MKSVVIQRKEFVNTCIFLILILLTQYSKLFPGISGIAEKIVSFMPIVLSAFFLAYAMTKKRDKQAVRDAKNILYLYRPYFLLLFMSFAFAIVFNRYAIEIYGFRYWSRALDKLLLRISFLIVVMFSWEMNKDKCIVNLKNALLIDGSFIVVLSIIRNGIGTTFKACLAPLGIFPENAASGILEVHEATFVIGLLLIYYICFQKWKDNWKTIFSLLLFFVIGGKRIAFLAFFLAIVVAFCIRNHFNRTTLVLISILIMLVTFVFLAGVYWEFFYDIANRFGININNRDLIYRFFTKRTKLSPLYCGWGFSSVSRVIENMDPLEVKWMAVVRGLHSDILKQYIEFGFWGYIYWLCYEMLYLPNKIAKKFSKNSSLLYVVFMIYAFVTYLTDNTEGYFLFQSVLLIAPMAASTNKQ